MVKKTQRRREIIGYSVREGSPRVVKKGDDKGEVTSSEPQGELTYFRHGNGGGSGSGTRRDPSTARDRLDDGSRDGKYRITDDPWVWYGYHSCTWRQKTCRWVPRLLQSYTQWTRSRRVKRERNLENVSGYVRDSCINRKVPMNWDEKIHRRVITWYRQMSVLTQ